MLVDPGGEPEGPEITEEHAKGHQHPWWQVMCLTGVDYFSTLGYLPAIAVAAAGSVAPIAVVFIALLTLAGMVPMYRVVARESPHGQGSVAMLEKLLDFWRGKLLVLVLLGFVATAWFVTITLSAADATAHIVQNPLVPASAHHPVLITLALILALGVVFLRGFSEAIGIAIALVVVYMGLNLVIVVEGFRQLIHHPALLSQWQHALTTSHGSPLLVLAAAFLVFPQLALGLSGFETGVGMMPLIRGKGATVAARLADRVGNARKMLLAAALIMTFYLATTTFITTLLIPQRLFKNGGPAEGRALAYLAHQQFGTIFGSLYDLSTVAILWFAGASAMAGLLNIVPRYLPRYGMAPDWTRMMRPLVLLNTVVSCFITIIFHADVNAQAGAYATGVLALMISASVAVLLFAVGAQMRRTVLVAATTALVLAYAFIANEFQNPGGLVITACFIGGIVVASLVSRVSRTTELRTNRVILDEVAYNFIAQADTDENGEIMIVAHRPRPGDGVDAYAHKEREQRLVHHLTTRENVLFLEMQISDASNFSDDLMITGHQVGDHLILKGSSSAVPNAIAAFLLYVRDEFETRPHCYFGWTEGNPLKYLLRYLLFGEGDTAPVTREVLRQAEPDSTKRPSVHVAG